MDKLINDIIESKRNVVVISDLGRGKSRCAQILAKTVLATAESKFANSIIFYYYDQRPIVEGIKSNKHIISRKSISRYERRGSIDILAVFDDIIPETMDKYKKYISYFSSQTKIVCFVDRSNLEYLPIDISTCDAFTLL